MKKYLEGFKGDIKMYMEESLKSNANEIKRATGIIYEEFQKKIDLIVEGHEVLDGKIDELKEEVTFELKDMRSMVKNLYKELDHRVKVLERARA